LRASVDDAVAAAQSLAAVAEAGQQLNLTSVSGSSRVTVRLDPESLGSVRLDVQRTDAGVAVQVTADTAAARQFVAANLDRVASALRAAGVEVGDFRLGGQTPAAPAAVAVAAPPAAPTPAVPAQPPSAAEVVAVGEADATVAVPADPESATGSPDPPVAGAPWAPPGGHTTPTGVAPPASAAPAAAAGIQLVKQIAEQIGLLGGQGKSDFQLQLNPASLGRLHVRLTMEDGAMTVRMTAQTPEARSAIESNLGQLRQSFQEQGIRVDRFVVVAGQANLGQDNQHPRRSRGWVDQQRSARRSEGDVDFAQALAAVGASRSLDYRA
jgi:flagellar hook-length control protein FliK